jgi:hypothetical protein
MGIFLLLASMGWSFIESMQSHESLQLRPANYQRTLDSIVSLDICSGVYVSNQGHILTALHCFEGAYPKDMQNAPAKNIHGRWEYGFQPQTVFGPGRRHQPGYLQDLYINEKSYEKAQIVFSGERLGVNYLDTSAEDFIILKVPVEGKTVCSPISFKRPQSGELVWSYGFPSGFVERNGQSVGDSVTLRISNGRVKSTVAQTIGRAVDAVRSEEEISMQEFLSDTMEYQKYTYLISTDVDEGMSGGPIFDKRGRVIGNLALAVPTLLPSDKKRANIQSIAGLIQSMRKVMTEEEIQEVFDCDAN